MGGSADRRYNASWIVERSVELKKPIVSSYALSFANKTQTKELA
jgi:hypothetical protein